MANLKVSFLNVGHGDFIYCETPHGDNMVIDCGCGEIVPSTFITSNSITELQVTHPHTDHFDDIIDLSEKTIQSFRCPQISTFDDSKIGWKKSDSEKIKKLKELQRDIMPNNYVVTTDTNFYYQVWESPLIDKEDPNTSSLVTLITYNNFKVLMGGDLPTDCWLELLKNKSFKDSIAGTTIFKTPHHGRENSYCKELFEVMSPILCIICDKPLDKDNENTCATDKYREAVKNGGGGLDFYRLSDGQFTGKRYVLTTRNDKSIFMNIQGLYNYNIKTYTDWE